MTPGTLAANTLPRPLVRAIGTGLQVHSSAHVLRRIGVSTSPGKRLFSIAATAASVKFSSYQRFCSAISQGTIRSARLRLRFQAPRQPPHATALLVTEINGVSQNEQSLRDTFSIPPATDTEPSVLKVVIPFTDPVITGRFVYHCHAVDHEDKGMMGIIEVVASASEVTDEPELCRGARRRL
jgi:Multicopper oxidase